MSAHRVAAAFGGAALVAALTIPGSQAAPAAESVSTVPTAATTTVGIAAVASYISSGSAFRIDVTISCATNNQGSVSLQAHQNVGNGFVANGWGYSRGPLTCDGKEHTVTLTVAPMGERGFRRGPAYVLADVSACVPNSETCNPVSAERTVTVR
jgi:hypothetical protein